MSNTAKPAEAFQLGPWRVRPSQSQITREGESVHLGPQQMDVLLHLVQRANQTVSREEILRAVWPDTVVEEGALTRCISEIRGALGDVARRPTYIQTIPKRGYRLIARVVPGSEESVRESEESVREPGESVREPEESVRKHKESTAEPAKTTERPRSPSRHLRHIGRLATAATLVLVPALLAMGLGALTQRRPAVDSTLHPSTHLKIVPSAEEPKVLPLPATRRALELLQTGQQYLLAQEARAAEEIFRKAVAEDPQHPEIALGLARALLLQGKDPEALAQARRAEELALDLPARSRIPIESYTAMIQGDSDAAVQAFQALTTLNPDDPEASLALILAQLRSGAYAAAARDAEDLAGLHPSDPRELLRLLYLARAELYAQSHSRALTSAQRAAEAAETAGAERVRHLALWYQAQSLQILGSTDESERLMARVEPYFKSVGEEGLLAELILTRSYWHRRRGEDGSSEKLAREALEIFRRLGSRAGEADARRSLALFPWTRGDPETGRRELGRALELYRQIGNRHGEASILNLLAVQELRIRRQDSEEHLLAVRTHLGEALKIFRRLENDESTAVVLHNLGQCDRRAGLAQAAAAAFEEAAELHEAGGRHSQAAVSWSSFGHSRIDSGDPRGALEAFQRTVKIGRDSGSRADVLPLGLFGQGIAWLTMGDYEAAGESLLESLEAWTRAPNPNMETWTHLGLAFAQSILGQEGGGIGHARQALAISQKVGDLDLIGRSRAVLAELLLAHGQPEEALDQAALLPPLNSQPQTLQETTALLSRAFVESRAESPARATAARGALKRILGFAHERNLPRLELKARLGLLESQAQSSEGLYLALENEAWDRGLGNLASVIRGRRELRYPPRI